MNLAITILNKFNARKFKLVSPHATSNKLTTNDQSKQTDKYVHSLRQKIYFIHTSS